MAEITRKLAANTRGQVFFVIATVASICCLVESFLLICYSLRVNATWQYRDSVCSSFQNGRKIGWFQW